MNHFSGYGAYLLFVGLKTHFSTKKYDFISMNGKLTANKHSYLERNDKQFFEALASRYTKTELKDFYIANLLQDNIYVIDYLNEYSHENFFNYVRRRNSITYNFKTEVEKLFEKGIDKVFLLKSDQYPIIIMEYLNNHISPETMVILNKFIHFFGKFNSKYSNDIIWSRISLKLEKYSSFVKYDECKIKHILKEVAKEHI